MQIKLFTIPITDSPNPLAEMNSFLSNHKVLEVEQHFYQNDRGAYWCFCIKYLIGANTYQTQIAARLKPDYKEILTESQFKVFTKLREYRKIIAAQDAVPAYAVFTDEELAKMSKLTVLDVSNLKTINGIGEKRVEKYGVILLNNYFAKD